MSLFRLQSSCLIVLKNVGLFFVKLDLISLTSCCNFRYFGPRKYFKIAVASFSFFDFKSSHLGVSGIQMPSNTNNVTIPTITRAKW